MYNLDDDVDAIMKLGANAAGVLIKGQTLKICGNGTVSISCESVLNDLLIRDIRLIIIEKGIKRIDNFAFSDMTGLKEIIGCEGLDYIAPQAFSDSKHLVHLGLSPDTRYDGEIFSAISDSKLEPTCSF